MIARVYKELSSNVEFFLSCTPGYKGTDFEIGISGDVFGISGLEEGLVQDFRLSVHKILVLVAILVAGATALLLRVMMA